MIVNLPIICKAILKKNVKSNSGLSTATFLIIIPMLIFSIALYETRWYCVNTVRKGGVSKYIFEYKNIKKYLVDLVISTVLYLIVICGVFIVNTYMNYSYDFKKNEGVIGYIKRNFTKVITGKMNIIIIVALFFPLFGFYFTNDYKTNKRWTMKLDD